MNAPRAVDKIKTRLGRPIAFYPSLVEIAGSVAGAVWLCQLLYWSARGSDPSGWIYKTQKQWESETGVGRSGQEAVRQRLVNMQILRVERRGWQGKTHFLLDLAKLAEAIDANQLTAAQTSTGSNAESRRELHRRDKAAGSNSTPELVEIPQTRSESRQETTHRAAAEARLLPAAELSFQQFGEQILRSIHRVCQLASLNRQQNPELDRLHLQRAHRLISDAIESGIDKTVIAAAITDVAWPSKIVPALRKLISDHDRQRRSDHINASLQANSDEAYRPLRDAREWLKSLSNAERDEIQREFLSEQPDVLARDFLAKPEALRCRSVFDRWLIVRYAEEQKMGYPDSRID